MSNQFELAEAYTQLTVHGENKFASTLNRVRKNVMATSRSMEAMAKHAKRMLLVGTGAMALFVKMAGTQEQAYRKLEAVLKATGGAAGYSADELAKYAAALQKTTVYGDEATMGVMALLASFKNINGSVFKETIALSQDIATVMGTDVKSAALQMGKALNDPAVGLTYLNRAGITFSKTQQDQIKHLASTNDLLGAQKIMLAEVASQFGGAAAANAKTFTGQILQLKNQLGDLAEEIGSSLFPVLKKFASKVSELASSIQGLTDSQKGGIATWTIFGGSMLAAVAIIPRLIAGIGSICTALAALGGGALAGTAIGLVIAGLVLLGAAFVTAKVQGQGFIDTLTAMIDDLRGVDNAVRNNIASLDKLNRMKAEGEAAGKKIVAKAVEEGKPGDIDPSIYILQAKREAEMRRQREIQGKGNYEGDRKADLTKSGNAIAQIDRELAGLIKARTAAAAQEPVNANVGKLKGMLPDWMTGNKPKPGPVGNALGSGASAVGEFMGGGFGGLTGLISGIMGKAQLAAGGVGGAVGKGVVAGRQAPAEAKGMAGGGSVGFADLNAKMQAAADRQTDRQIKLDEDRNKKIDGVEAAIKWLPSQMPKTSAAWG